jgi:hypothetical protein
MNIFDKYATKPPEKEEKRSICEYCYTSFVPKRKWQRFCQPNCRVYWFNAKEKDKGVFCDMTKDSQPEEIKDDAKKPTIDVFASFQAARPPAHEEP